MLSQSSQSKPAYARPKLLLQTFWQTHKVFTLSAFFTMGLLIFFTLGIFLDERIITGAPAWLKPAKFAVSITIYSFTMLWFLSFIDISKRWRKHLVQILGWTLTLTFLAEWVAIITQAARGTTSHFNIATSLDAALWGLMAAAIMILFIANLIIAALLLFQKFDKPAFGWAIRLGIIITIIGLAEGYLMTSPTAQQMAGWQAGGTVTIAGAHTVGAPDGGKGLAFLTWSTEGGDLRIGHFFGMHALQVLPFLGFLVTRRRNLSYRQQLSLIITSAVTYLSFTLLLTWQALRAQPITQPDALTVGVFFSIVGLSCLAIFITLIKNSSLSKLKFTKVT